MIHIEETINNLTSETLLNLTEFDLLQIDHYFNSARVFFRDRREYASDTKDIQSTEDILNTENNQKRHIYQKAIYDFDHSTEQYDDNLLILLDYMRDRTQTPPSQDVVNSFLESLRIRWEESILGFKSNMPEKIEEFEDHCNSALTNQLIDRTSNKLIHTQAFIHALSTDNFLGFSKEHTVTDEELAKICDLFDTTNGFINNKLTDSDAHLDEITKKQFEKAKKIFKKYLNHFYNTLYNIRNENINFEQQEKKNLYIDLISDMNYLNQTIKSFYNSCPNEHIALREEVINSETNSLSYYIEQHITNQTQDTEHIQETQHAQTSARQPVEALNPVPHNTSLQRNEHPIEQPVAALNPVQHNTSLQRNEHPIEQPVAAPNPVPHNSSMIDIERTIDNLINRSKRKLTEEELYDIDNYFISARKFFHNLRESTSKCKNVEKRHICQKAIYDFDSSTKQYVKNISKIHDYLSGKTQIPPSEDVINSFLESLRIRWEESILGFKSNMPKTDIEKFEQKCDLSVKNAPISTKEPHKMVSTQEFIDNLNIVDLRDSRTHKVDDKKIARISNLFDTANNFIKDRLKVINIPSDVQMQCEKAQKSFDKYLNHFKDTLSNIREADNNFNQQQENEEKKNFNQLQKKNLYIDLISDMRYLNQTIKSFCTSCPGEIVALRNKFEKTLAGQSVVGHDSASLVCNVGQPIKDFNPRTLNIGLPNREKSPEQSGVNLDSASLACNVGQPINDVNSRTLNIGLPNREKSPKRSDEHSILEQNNVPRTYPNTGARNRSPITNPKPEKTPKCKCCIIM